MTESHRIALEYDYKESKDMLMRATIRCKMIVYALQRRLQHIYLKKRLEGLASDSIYKTTDFFLWNEGGMFKTLIYNISNKMKPLRDATVLVAGVGFGRHLFSLAKYRPKKLICFDLYSYETEWDYVSRIIQKEFGCDIEFAVGDITSIPAKYTNSFDWIISDAVLEHVQDLPTFAEVSHSLLKPRGIFYAGYGPIWYGPNGDHIVWEDSSPYEHLLLPEELYSRRINERFKASSLKPFDSCDGQCMAETKLFSYLCGNEYLTILKESGFSKQLLFSKIHIPAYLFLKKNSNINMLLDEKDVPLFDRLCSGFYLWMRRA